MLAARVRSGLAETTHHGAVAVCRPDGSLVAWSGDIDRPYFLRSAAKPFQVFVSQEAGAALAPVELAVAAGSHRGHPVQVAIVESMLHGAGLDDNYLKCPHDWPLAGEAARRLVRRGERRPRRIWHNCSGKHAGFLRACVAQGWPTESYFDPSHPLQKRVIGFVSELGDHPVEPVGVDGCGVPVLRTTARSMALLFARLGSEPSLRQVFETMHRYPALVAGNGAGDTSIAIAVNAAAKGGAQGCIGVALDRRLGIAAKGWDGLYEVATLAAVSALDELGELGPTAGAFLEPVARPEVLGGSRVVGELKPRLELETG